jgi:sugar phosphate isomerase/epimerase
MHLCISQVCTLPNSFADDLADYAAAGWTCIEVWLTKLEQHLEKHSPADTKALLKQYGVSLAAASYQGGLLLSQGDARRAAFDHFKRRLELCQQFEIPVLALVADFATKPNVTDLARSLVSLTEAARWAAGFNVKLALEFRGEGSFCNCLDTAITLVEESGEPNVGVCLDLFHYYKGPSKPDDLERLTTANLAHVQICDVAGVPRELMTDADRVLPGEGDFHLMPILERLKAIVYRGMISVELMNPILWKSKPSQVAELGLTAMQRFHSATLTP